MNRTMTRQDEMKFLQGEVKYLKLVDEYNELNKKVFDENILIVRSVSNCIETIAQNLNFDIDTLKGCYQLMNIPIPDAERPWIKEKSAIILPEKGRLLDINGNEIEEAIVVEETKVINDSEKIG